MFSTVAILFGFCICNHAAPAEPQILLNDSTILECTVPDPFFSCGELRDYAARWRHGRLLAAVRNALDSLGYFGPRWDTLPGKTFRLTPGRRAIVAAESLVVADGAGIDSLAAPVFPVFYDAGGINRRLSELARRLAERGHPYARISVSIVRAHGTAVPGAAIPGDSLAVRYSIAADRACLFGRALLTGATSTGMKTLLRDVRIHEGEPFDVRKIEETVEALSRRTYIASAAAGAPSVEPVAPRGVGDSTSPSGAERVSVPITVRDRSGLGIEGALGYASSAGGRPALQGDMTISFLNLFHTGESASLLYAGDRTFQKFSMETAKPWLFGYSLTGAASFGLEVHTSEYGYLEGMLKAYAEVSKSWCAGMSIRGSETTLDSAGKSWNFFGADFFLSLPAEPMRDGVRAREFSLTTGGGIAGRERNYTRSHVDFSGGLQAPLWRHHALHVRLVTGHLISNETDLVSAELYRAGGYRSVRGYFENEFAFRTIAYSQCEYLYYFSPAGSAYIFLDGGFGFERSISRAHWGDRREFLGYGLGLRAPARLGTFSLEWARNIDDTKSLGRIHVGVSSNK